MQNELLTLEPSLNYYIPKWCQQEMNIQDKINISNNSYVWLIFENDYGLGLNIGGYLKKSNQIIIYIKNNSSINGCSVKNNNEIELNPFQGNSYQILIRFLRANHLMPNYILYLWSYLPDQAELTLKNFNKLQYLNFYSLFFLNQLLYSRALHNSYFVSFSLTHFKFADDKIINYQMAPLIGAIKSLVKENHKVGALHLDLGYPDKINYNLILRKIFKLREKSCEIVALRKNILWQQKYEQLNPLTLWPLVNHPFITSGIYVITGGLGGLGLAFAKHIAAKVKTTIILVSRRSFSNKNNCSQASNLSLVNKYITEQLKIIEQLGSKVYVYKCDVSNADEVISLFAKIKNRFQTFNGIIHSAGVGSAHIKCAKTISSIAEILHPKILGTINLIKYSKNFILDFMVLCSSIDSVMGGIGNMEYCSANAFLDIIKELPNLSHVKKLVTINWNQISDVGMTVDFINKYGGKIANDAITAATAAKILELSIANNLKQLILSKDDMTIFN